MRATPYLNFNGQCEEAFRFYEQLLGGRIEVMQTHGDSPVAPHVPADWHDSILHARLVAGDTVLMGSDSPSERYERPQGIYVSLQLTDPAEAERIFSGLADGGTVTMPIEKTFWAERFGMLVDRYGTPWMINCDGAQ
jgi:PhnB protein